MGMGAFGLASLLKQEQEMFGNTAKNLQLFYDEINKGIEKANDSFKKKGINAKAYPAQNLTIEHKPVTNKQTSKEVGITFENVRKRIQRFRKKLRDSNIDNEEEKYIKDETVGDYYEEGVIDSELSQSLPL